jgi:hypothetical protein
VTGTGEPLDARGVALVDDIVRAAGDSLDAVVFFGSRRAGLATTGFSAYDLILSARSPGALYTRLRAAGLLARSPALLSLLDRALPPTQIRIGAPFADAIAKAAVVASDELRRSTSPGRRDQFLAGRLFQDVHLVWARDAEARRGIESAIQSARRITLDWVAPDLPRTFDASSYARQLLRTSFRFEIRPESGGRADAVFEAQRAALATAFGTLLDEWARDGRLSREPGGTFALRSAPGAAERFRRRVFLERSRIRATLRWPKHALTFDGWLEYIVRKAERHSGEAIELSPLEKKAPFIFLWPRVFRFLRAQRRTK